MLFPLKNLTGIFENWPEGQIGCLFSDCPADVLAQLRTWGSNLPQGRRILFCRIDKIPVFTALLEKIVQIFAEASAAVWPDWYGQRKLFAEEAGQSWQAILDRMAGRQIQAGRPAILGTWLSEATVACRAKRIPLLEEFSLTVQLQQLALTLAEQPILAAVALECLDGPKDRILGFARAVDWFARETGTRTLVIVPEQGRKRTELDGISALEVVVPTKPVSERAHLLKEERKLLICPILGRPHPGSPGEQLLAQHLERDQNLAKLFRYNQRVRTVFDNHFLVDLLWEEGKVIVEVDGYGFHSSPASFVYDRHRDHEMLLSGYLVLRLPHDGVVDDVGLAVERIRELVSFRRKAQGGNGP